MTSQPPDRPDNLADAPGDRPGPSLDRRHEPDRPDNLADAPGDRPERRTTEAGRFRLGYVPGATPAKWVRTWRERTRVPLELVPLSAHDGAPAILAGDCDMAILRPPVDRDRLHAIPLYEERPVVVVSKDHLLAALDPEEEVRAADLADEVVLRPLDDVLDWPGRLPGRAALDRPATTKDAIELVAAGVGVVIVPQSLARLHHRRDVTYRPVIDAPVAPVVLAWLVEPGEESERGDVGALIEQFIGIVRGRTANSSRGRSRSAAGTRDAARSAPGEGSEQQSRVRRGRSSDGERSGGGDRASSGVDRRGQGRSSGSGRGSRRGGRRGR